MAIELQALKCPHCGESSGLVKESLGRYKCKFCGSIVLSQGEDESSLIVLPSEDQWKAIHQAVKNAGTDQDLLNAANELNKAFPVNLEAEIQSIDQQSASTIKIEIQGLAGELGAYPNKGKTWNRLAEVVLRVVFCRSLFGDFDTVAQIVADIKECDAINPHFWGQLYQNYFSVSGKGGDLTTLLSVSKIKQSLSDKFGNYDEVAFYEFAEFLMKTAKTDEQLKFYVAFINDTLNDEDFVTSVYPVKTLIFSRRKRKHIKVLNKAYKGFSKRLERSQK